MYWIVRHSVLGVQCPAKLNECCTKYIAVFISYSFRFDEYRFDTLIKVNILHASITTIHWIGRDNTVQRFFSHHYNHHRIDSRTWYWIRKKSWEVLRIIFSFLIDGRCALRIMHLHFVDGTLSFILSIVCNRFRSTWCLIRLLFFYFFIWNS